MKWLVSSLLCLSAFAFLSADSNPVAAQEKTAPKTEKIAQKYHVYTSGCRLGFRQVLATNSLWQVRSAVEAARKKGLQVHVASGDVANEVQNNQAPDRYEVYSSICRSWTRCGVTDVEKTALALAEKEDKNGVRSLIIAMYERGILGE